MRLALSCVGACAARRNLCLPSHGPVRTAPSQGRVLGQVGGLVAGGAAVCNAHCWRKCRIACVGAENKGAALAAAPEGARVGACMQARRGTGRADARRGAGQGARGRREGQARGPGRLVSQGGGHVKLRAACSNASPQVIPRERIETCAPLRTAPNKQAAGAGVPAAAAVCASALGAARPKPDKPQSAGGPLRDAV